MIFKLSMTSIFHSGCYLLNILWILQSTRQDSLFSPVLYPVGQVYTAWAWRPVSHTWVAHVAAFQAPNKWMEKKPFSSSIMGVHLSVYMCSQMEKRLNSYIGLWTEEKNKTVFKIKCLWDECSGVSGDGWLTDLFFSFLHILYKCAASLEN